MTTEPTDLQTTDPTPDERRRACYLDAPKLMALNHAVLIVDRAFDGTCYLVGSSLWRRNFRDVDVRIILDDNRYDQIFPGQVGGKAEPLMDAYWSLICTAVSAQLARQCSLPIDFQVQRRTQANDLYRGKLRMPLGLFPYWSWPNAGRFARPPDDGGDGP